MSEFVIILLLAHSAWSFYDGRQATENVIKLADYSVGIVGIVLSFVLYMELTDLLMLAPFLLILAVFYGNLLSNKINTGRKIIPTILLAGFLYALVGVL